MFSKGLGTELKFKKDSCLTYAPVVVLAYGGLSLKKAYRETERGFEQLQMCSHAVLQNPNCMLLDMNDSVHQSNAD